jgi:predicted ArsR family transcriptional regulator
MDRAVAALRDLTRRDILLRFYSDPTPRTAEEVARAAHVHRSVAFDHLERLVGLGYLDTELRRGLVGKPAKLYRLTSGPLLLSHPARQFDSLARGLAQALETLGLGGEQAARRAGRKLGRDLGSGRPGGLRQAVAGLSELGAEYEVEGEGEVVATNCVFLEACSGEGVVCEFHAGLLEGALENSGLDVRLVAGGRRGPFGCGFGVQDAHTLPAEPEMEETGTA